MSKKVTKVDGSIDEKNGLKYTVGDKSLGLLSTTIDKALMLKGEETQLKCSPEYAEGANIDLTLVQVTRKRFRTRLPQRKQSQRMSLRKVSQFSKLSTEKAVDEKAAEEKMTIAKSTVANVAVKEPQSRRRHIPTGDTWAHHNMVSM